MIRHLSLFSGIGGFDLASEWMGWNNIAHCEISEFNRKILKHYWPNAESIKDITTTNFSRFRGKIDIITGGFPCQPFSVAGKRKGKDDNRYLWPEMLRAINEVRPTWVVGENVAGITSMVFDPRQTKVESQTTLEGQEIHRTMESESVIERICEDFESIGYSVQPINIPACGVGAPHKRERIWFVGHNSSGDDGGNNSRKSSAKRVEMERDVILSRGRFQGPNDFNSPNPKVSTNNWGERNERRFTKEVPELRSLQRGEDGGVYAHFEGRSDILAPVLCRSYEDNR